MRNLVTAHNGGPADKLRWYDYSRDSCSGGLPRFNTKESTIVSEYSENEELIKERFYSHASVYARERTKTNLCILNGRWLKRTETNLILNEAACE